MPETKPTPADETTPAVFTPGESDPAGFTVDQVNDALDAVKADHPDDYDDAVGAVLTAENAGQARVTITEGRHGATPPAPEPDPVAEHVNPTDADLEQRRTDDLAAEAANGYAGAVTSTEGRPLQVDESAPEDVDLDRASGVDAPEGTTLATAPPTMAQQTAPRLKGAEYRQGYYGTLPDADNRPDLTLQGVLAQADTSED